MTFCPWLLSSLQSDVCSMGHRDTEGGQILIHWLHFSFPRILIKQQ